MQMDVRPRSFLKLSQSNRMIGNVVRNSFLIAGLALAILAVSPEEWVRKLGAWADFIRQIQTDVMAATILILTVLLMIARQPFLARLEYILPSEYRNIPDMMPRGMQSRVADIIDQIGEDDRIVRERIVRIIVLTGRSTLNYLDQISDKYRLRNDWDVRILIMDPASPEVGRLGEGRRAEIVASCALLQSIKRRAESKERRVKLSWRGYSTLPMIRAFMIDEAHMFFGYFVWRLVENEWELHEQNKKFIYAKRGDNLSTDSIDFFKSWFDYQWDSARNLEDDTSLD